MKRHKIAAAVLAAAALTFSGCAREQETGIETTDEPVQESTAGEILIYDDAQDAETENSSAEDKEILESDN